MDILASKHHITLEEIGRLEAEKKALERKIAALRATLPREVIAVEGKPQSSREVPVATILAPEKKSEPRISDHAIIRYLERRFKFDFEAVRNDLMTKAIKSAILMGVRAIKVEGGRFIVRNGTITTFVPKRDQRSVRSKRAARRT